MPSKELKIWDKIVIIIISISWIFLFANIGKNYIDPQAFGEVIGVICGISFSITSLYIYKKLLGDKK